MNFSKKITIITLILIVGLTLTGTAFASDVDIMEDHSTYNKISIDSVTSSSIIQYTDDSQKASLNTNYLNKDKTVEIFVTDAVTEDYDGNGQVETSKDEISSVKAAALNKEEVNSLGATITPTGQTFADIQNAIDNANDGDTISLTGTYTGNSTIFINKNINIIGNGNVIFSGENYNVDDFFIFIDGSWLNVSIKNIIIKDFTLSEYSSTLSCFSPTVVCDYDNITFINIHNADDGTFVNGLCMNTFSAKYALIKNCNFFNCSSTNPYYDGVATDNAGDAVVCLNGNAINCTFINCSTPCHAGAICILPDSNSSLVNCTIINCTSNYGGAIAIHGDYTNIVNCTIINCSANKYGGAIYTGVDNDYNYNAIISNCTMINCSAREYGGGYYAKGDGFKFENNYVDNCSAILGGGIYVKGKDEVITSNAFINCTSNYGAGVYVEGSNAIILNDTFIANTADCGGAAYVIGNSTNIKNIYAVNNSADYGGAYYIKGDNTTIFNGTAQGNTAIDGGAFYIIGSNTNISHINFISNHAIPIKDTPYNDSKMNDGLGGAGLIDGIFTNLEYLTFENNTARNGSGVYLSGSNISVISCVTPTPNQAWSYLLPINYTLLDNETIVVDVVHYGGNNINGGTSSGNYIYLNSTNYNLKVDGQVPVDGVENSNNGNLLFKDDREQYQLIYYNVNGTGITGNQITELAGNITFTFETVDLENNVLYKISATHNNDSYYTYITNSTVFTLPKPNINKTVTPDPALKGERMEYVLTITNIAPLEANFVVIDYLPQEFVYQGANVTPTSINGRTLSWNVTIDNVSSGNNVLKILIWGYANVSGTNLTNNLVVWSGTKNVTTNVTSEILPMGNLIVNKTANINNATVGDIIEWTITVHNNGPNATEDVVAKDLLPNGIVYDSHSVDVGSYDSTTGVWYIGTINNGGTVTLHLRTKVTSDAYANNAINVTNIINVTTSTPEQDPNNTDKARNSTPKIANATVDLRSAVLTIEKTSDKSRVKKGESFIWTVTIKNNGNWDAINVKLSEFLPKNVTVNSMVFNYGGTVLNLTGLTEYTIPILRNNTSGRLIINCTATTSNNNLTNIVFATTEDTVSPNGSYINISTNNTVFVDPVADLTVDKQVIGVKMVKINDTIIWKITVTNKGPDKAINVIARDKLPNGLMYNNHTVDVGAYDINTGVWTIGDLEAGQSVSIYISANVTVSNTNITNIVVVTSPTNNSNGVPNNVTDNDTVVVGSVADLVISKVVNVTSAEFGDYVKWTVVVVNNGPDAAENVVITDYIPEELVFINCSVSEASVVGNVLTWNVGTLANGASVTLDIVTRVNVNNTDVINIANVVSTTPGDGGSEINESANNTTTVVDFPDPGVNKTSNASGKVYKGDELTYTISVKNNAHGDVVYIVSDVLPGELIFNGASGDYSYDPVSRVIVWSVLIGAGETVDLEVYSVVNASNVTILQPVSVTNKTFDVSVDNNTTDLVEPLVNLTITKIVDKKVVNLGDNVIWTIVVRNNGPDCAENVVITDLIPAELELLSASVDTGSFDEDTGIWTVGALSKDQVVSLTLVTLVVKSNVVIVNNATVISSTPGVDENGTVNPNGTNKSTSNDTTVLPAADLSVIKEVNLKKVKVGDKVVYTITVINNGPDAAHNVIVRELLPSDVSFMSAIVSTGIYDDVDNVWTIDVLGTSETATLKITVKAMKEGIITNVVVVTSDEFDPDDSNNNDSVDLEVDPLDNETVTGIPMQHTGNPILVLLVMIALCGIGLLRRKN